MAIAFDVRRATRDVDAVVHGAPDFLREAVLEVAAEEGWPEDWLNDGVKGFLSSAEEMRLMDSFSAADGSGLRIHVPSPQYMFAMKSMAMRPEGIDGSHDISDIEPWQTWRRSRISTRRSIWSAPSTRNSGFRRRFGSAWKRSWKESSVVGESSAAVCARLHLGAPNAASADPEGALSSACFACQRVSLAVSSVGPGRSRRSASRPAVSTPPRSNSGTVSDFTARALARRRPPEPCRCAQLLQRAPEIYAASLGGVGRCQRLFPRCKTCRSA